jgi:hypothetical protein
LCYNVAWLEMSSWHDMLGLYMFVEICFELTWSLYFDKQIQQKCCLNWLIEGLNWLVDFNLGTNLPFCNFEGGNCLALGFRGLKWWFIRFERKNRFEMSE